MALDTGRRAHHRCSVLGCPWRIALPRIDAWLMASSGSVSSNRVLIITSLIPRPRALRRSRYLVQDLNNFIL